MADKDKVEDAVLEEIGVEETAFVTIEEVAEVGAAEAEASTFGQKV